MIRKIRSDRLFQARLPLYLMSLLACSLWLLTFGDVLIILQVYLLLDFRVLAVGSFTFPTSFTVIIHNFSIL